MLEKLCLPHGSQKAERNIERGLSPLQGHTPNDLTFFDYISSLKGSTLPPVESHSGDHAFHMGFYETFKIQSMAPSFILLVDVTFQ
jgi:hypothetical protein